MDEPLKKHPKPRLRLAIVRREAEIAFLKTAALEANVPGQGHSAEIIPLGSRKTRPPARLRKDHSRLKMDDHIGQQLQAVYDDVVSQPIPDRFLELLSQLGKESNKEEDAR